MVWFGSFVRDTGNMRAGLWLRVSICLCAVGVWCCCSAADTILGYDLRGRLDQFRRHDRIEQRGQQLGSRTDCTDR
jgi:hypothetical protein